MKVAHAAGLALAASVGSALGFDQEHSMWSEVVSRYAEGGRFDYRGAQASQPKIDRFPENLSQVSEKKCNDWEESEQVAFPINPYNAAGIDLVLGHYPVRSIRDIASGGPWKTPVVRLFGDTVTLDHLEHEMVRENFLDPHVHFAINCASVGCPALRSEAFKGAAFDRQREEQTTVFFAHLSSNRVGNGKLSLSPIFGRVKGERQAFR